MKPHLKVVRDDENGVLELAHTEPWAHRATLHVFTVFTAIMCGCMTVGAAACMCGVLMSSDQELPWEMKLIGAPILSFITLLLGVVTSKTPKWAPTFAKDMLE